MKNSEKEKVRNHKTIDNYISAKFKLLKNQNKNSIAFINKYDKNIQSRIKENRYLSKIINVDTKLKKKFISKFCNEYFLSVSNIENLSFIIELSKKFNVKIDDIIHVVNKFKGLNYRQQIIFNKKFLHHDSRLM